MSKPPPKPDAWHRARSDVSSRTVTVTGGHDWGSLPRTTERAQFPTESLPELLRSYVQGLSEQLQVPPDLPGLLALPVISGCTRGRYDVQGPWREPSVAVYSAVFLPPGELKSPTLSEVAAPLREYEAALRDQASVQVARAREQQELVTERVKRSRSDLARNPHDVDTQAEYESALAEQERCQVPVMPQLISGDITPERLAVLMSEQGETLSLLSAEGGLISVLQGSYNDGRANLDLVNSSYSAEPVTVDRQSRESVRLARPHLAIGLAVQPDVLRQMREHREMLHRGFLDRFLFAVPEPRVGTRQLHSPRLEPAIRNRWHKHLTALLNESTRLLESGDRRSLTLTPGALALYEPWWTELEKRCRETGDLSCMTGWVQKARGGALRMAALFELLSDPAASTVQESSLAASMAVCDYLVTHALYVFGDPVTGPTAHTLSAVRRHTSDVFTARDMLRRLQGRTWCKHSENVEAELARLGQLGYVRPLPKQPGSKSQQWQKHPHLHE